MQEILTRAGCFVAIIVLGYALRAIGYFKEGDFTVLSKIVIRITLPAAIVTSFSGKEIDPAMLAIALIGLGAGLVYMTFGFVMNLRGTPKQKAFGIINTAGYNIGNFTLPFVQSFLGSVGVITTSLFDVGNAMVCLGGSYGVAAMVQNGEKFSPARIARSLAKSVPFMTYLIMLTLNLTGISLPGAVVDFAGIIANANAFMAMLMIGVGFKMPDLSLMGSILKILAVRYAFAAAVAVGCYFLLPFALEVRQALVILAFSPIGAAAPAYTGDLDNDVGLSCALNSMSIICSIVIIVTLLLVML